MFVSVARVTLEIPESGSLKAKRQVLRRVVDRVKARFNASVSEVGEQEKWQRAQIALTVVGGDKPHVQEQMDKILQFIEDMYVAPVMRRETEILSFGDTLFSNQAATEGGLPIELGERSLAEAEGLGDWESRHEWEASGESSRALPREDKDKLPLDKARERARALRNRREWESEK